MDKYESYDITDEQWKAIEPLMPPEYTGKKGRPRKDNRTMVNGILWINRSGAQWRQLPEKYGPWQSVYARFAKWRDNGVWEQIFAELSKDADTENYSMDSTCVKVHQSSNGGEKSENKAVGRTKGGINTKIHAIVDGLGNPVAFLLSPGNDADSTHAICLMKKIDIEGSNVLGDKAYGTKEILAYIKEHGADVVIPPKSNTKEPWEVDYCLYKERHLVECFFQKIKWFRRIATRYDKLDKSFLSFVYMAACMIWLL